MAADYAGALDATKDYFEAAWAARTAVAYVAGQDVNKHDGQSRPTEWAFYEIVHAPSWTAGRGVPGNNVIVYPFNIKVHVFSPIGQPTKPALQLALAAGEIFRNKLFYNAVTDGCYVRSGYETMGQPRISEGDIAADNGNWLSTTCTIPAEYWHRG